MAIRAPDGANKLASRQALLDPDEDGHKKLKDS